MRKLMTALAAVAGAIGLQAAAFTDTGTSFEDSAWATTGPSEAYVTNFTDAAVVAQGELQSGTYWNLPDAAEGVEVNLVVDTQNKSVTGKGAVKKFSSATHYATLSLSTGKNAEVERYAADGGTVVNLGGESSGVDGTSLHFDSLVKFTAFDQDKTPAEVLGDDGKIAIWVRENLDDNGEPVSTNLIVTAGYVNESYGLTPTNYVCTYSVPAGATLCDWHRVTVKAMRTIVDGDVYPGFAIAIDGNVIGTDADDKGFGNFPSGISLTNIASGFDEIGGVFPSVQKGSANANVKSVAFKGIGEVDDLVFTEDAPIDEFAESGNVTIRGDANVTGFTYTIGSSDGVIVQGNSATIQFSDVENETVTISDVTCAAGYVYGNLTAQGATIISGDAASGIEDMAVITINTTLGGAVVGDRTFATAAEAFDAINNGDITPSGTDPITVVLAKDASEGVALTADVSVILDLAGNSIIGKDSSDTAAIYMEGGSLTITNTAATGGVVATDADLAVATEDYAVGVTAGTLTIGGGIYNGIVEASGATEFKIFNGSFLAASVEVSDTTDILNAAVKLAYSSEDYGLAKEGDYYVVRSSVVSYTVTFVDLENVDSPIEITRVAGYVLGAADIPELTGKSGYTVAWDSDPLGAEVDQDLTFTAVYTGKSFTIVTYTNGVEVANATTNFTYDSDTASAIVPAISYNSGTEEWNGKFYESDGETEFAFDETGDLTQYAYATITAKQGGLDPASGTTEAHSSAATPEAAEADAKSNITVPSDAASAVSKADYAAYFKYGVSGTAGDYTVSITGIVETVEANVAASAVERLTSATATTIAVPAGLYYSITPSTALPISGTAEKGLSTGGTVTIGKPGTTAGFYEIKVSATPIQ